MTENGCLIHIVGSMPLGGVEEVMSTTADMLGSRVKRFSNGEVGRTTGWIMAHHQVFRGHPAFEEYVHTEKHDQRTSDQRRPRFRLRAGASVPLLDSFESLGYAADVRDAFAVFSRMKAEGKIDPNARLQVAFPTPYDVLNFAIDQRDFPVVFPLYEGLFIRELSEISGIVPHHELAVQWDAAHEFEFLATGSPMFNTLSRDDMVSMLARLGEAVPSGADLGYHCCYGNFNLKHFVEPVDMSDMVDVMNKVKEKLRRPVQFIHMPVPVNRFDEGYFRPLRDLRSDADCEIYLGLVHDTDGVEGALNRAGTARKFLSQFGISTECGLAQRTVENVRQILQINADAAAALDKSAMETLGQPRSP